MTERFSLKDHLFNKDSITILADYFFNNDFQFPRQKFIKKILVKFPQLELKQRIVHIREILADTLPADYPTALKIILEALPPQLDPKKTDDDFGEFILAPLSDYVANYGCTSKYLSISLDALREMTKRFSAEDAIRYFINAFPEKTMAFLKKCSKDPNYHVRRLSSEGTRPLLPWSHRLVIDSHVTLSILSQLFADSTRYVTRSVANHMNDISKQDPDIVLRTLKQWQKSNKQKPKEMDFIVRHSLRTLVKQGNLKALGLLGYNIDPKIHISNFRVLTSIVVIGNAVEFTFDITSLQKQNLRIDYVIHFANPRKDSKKVYSIKQCEMADNEQRSFHKRHSLRVMTTKRLYSGKHMIELIINGQTQGRVSFDLKK